MTKFDNNSFGSGDEKKSPMKLKSVSKYLFILT